MIFHPFFNAVFFVHLVSLKDSRKTPHRTWRIEKKFFHFNHQLAQQLSTNNDVFIVLQQSTMNSPCFLDIFQAGPSRERSTSMGLSFVALPNVICGARRTDGGNAFAMTSNLTIQCWKTISTSRDLMRYRTIRPLKAARVWLSKSGMLIPGRPPRKGETSIKTDHLPAG